MEPTQETTFHVAARGSKGHADFYWSWQAASPQGALERSIAELPSGWVGGIEVTDDETNSSNEMPLIDYWKES